MFDLFKASRGKVNLAKTPGLEICCTVNSPDAKVKLELQLPTSCFGGVAAVPPTWLQYQCVAPGGLCFLAIGLIFVYLLRVGYPIVKFCIALLLRLLLYLLPSFDQFDHHSHLLHQLVLVLRF